MGFSEISFIAVTQYIVCDLSLFPARLGQWITPGTMIGIVGTCQNVNCSFRNVHLGNHPEMFIVQSAKGTFYYLVYANIE